VIVNNSEGNEKLKLAMVEFARYVASRSTLREQHDIIDRKLRQNPKDAEMQMERARVLARLGQTANALAAREQAVSLDPTDLIAFAQVSSALGRTNEALDRLELAMKKGFKNYVWLKVQPDLQNLSDQPRFQALLAQYLK
jgi:tetratricopeptide (TPR) repeat protein